VEMGNFRYHKVALVLIPSPLREHAPKSTDLAAVVEVPLRRRKAWHTHPALVTLQQKLMSETAEVCLKNQRVLAVSPTARARR
ncbi:MAG: hypothetical protein JWP34_3738, partial [Massilia sp.]|nr:hypothetical protein [Massilia sp.]